MENRIPVAKKFTVVTHILFHRPLHAGGDDFHASIKYLHQ